MFIDHLIRKIEEKKNPTVLGLDPVLSYVPEWRVQKSFAKHGKNLEGAAKAIWKFNKKILESVSDLVPAVKLQMACYEMYGIHGLKVFAKTVNLAKERGLLVIADGKRNDIGSSAQCYAEAYLGETRIDDGVSQRAFGVDALTVNPYLGEDGLIPFIEQCSQHGKGIFVLVKTSNPSSGQIQDLNVWAEGEEKSPLYNKVGALVQDWGKAVMGENGYSSVGAVVGATYPQEAQILRQSMKGVFFLVPGYGAQGAKAEDLLPFFDENQKGAIVHASRSIMLAYQSDLYKNQFGDKDFHLASREEVIRMRDALNEVLGA
jgi:orotidine-5'-phosphate decarboxylase